MTQLPRITLVTPVLDGVAHIAETIESVLRQEYAGLEYVVVDGGSTDGTVDIVRAYAARTDFPQRIARVVSEPDRGMYDAVAKGFDGAGGEVLGYLNADDLLEPGGLLGVGREFAADPGVQAIFHEDTVLVNGWKYPNVRQPRRVTTGDLLRGHILFQDGVYFRKSLYQAAGGVRRDLRLAGDYDLWLRMSSLARFVRRDRHVSCFRVRAGQLSGDMERYEAEMVRARADFLRGRTLLRRAAWKVAGFLGRVRGRLGARRERLFFPIDFANMPPPDTILPAAPGAQAARSPVDGTYAERLLFSTIDNRFGERELNYIYFDSRNRIAIAYPPVESAKLDALYRKYYSSPPKRIVPAQGGSPYRGFDRRRAWEKAAFSLPIERVKGIRMPTWDDTTLQELWAVLRDAGVKPNRSLRVLDTACFEGKFLDRMRNETPWQAFGIEPNELAVAVAREKGHEVWQAHAERATEVLPADRRFDVVYLGQMIEHVEDPVVVLQRLRTLLAPGGVLVVSTPNLDSHQVRWFGPTWAHWHPPFHRHVFSRQGLFALARRAGLHPRGFRTFSHPYWTAMSIALHELGLGAAVSHAAAFDGATCKAALRVDWWARWWWNRRGEGDYAFLVMAQGEHG